MITIRNSSLDFNTSERPQLSRNNIFNDELTDERVKEVAQFILEAKGKKTIPFDTVRKLYSDFTMEALIEKILKENI